MAVTRIKNNQITDSTITYAKIANGTLVGSNFNPNITLNSNVSIIGNLDVTGNTTTVNSIDTLINDPLVIFNNGYVGTPSYDVGLLVNRNLSALGTYGGMNTAWIWDETAKAFAGYLTTETGATIGTINKSFLANIKIGNVNIANALVVSGSLTAGLASFAAINNTVIGNTQPSTGWFTGLYGQNFSTGNAQITGGYADNFSIGANVVSPVGSFTTLLGTNFSSGNARVTGGYLDNVPIGANVVSPAGYFSTLLGTNFSTGNAVVTGGYLDNVPIGANVVSPTGRFTNLYGTNFSSGNAYIASGYADNFNIGANTISQVGRFTNLYSTNFSSGNVIITGGYLDNTPIGANVAAAGRFTTAYAQNFSTGNAYITGGYLDNTPIGANVAAPGRFTTAYAQNFSTGNAYITGGYLDNTPIGANTISPVGRFTNLYSTNFSTGNAVITGGYADNFNIGGNIGANANVSYFTTNNIVKLLDPTNAVPYVMGSGALYIAGGVSIAKDLWMGGNLYVANVISESTTVLEISDPLVYLNADSPTYNYDIGFFSQFVNPDNGQDNYTGAVRSYIHNYWGFFSNVSTRPTNAQVDFADTDIIWDTLKAGDMIVGNTTISTSSSTGALRVSGGAGIGGALWIQNTGDVSANIGAYQTYANANVAAIQANLGAYQTYANANVAAIQANIGAYQTYANANVAAIQANIGAYQTYANANVATIQANIGAYQTYANANVATIQANIGAYQTYANANVAAIQANIGAFEDYANTKIGTNSNSNLVVVATTTSTSTTTGALVVAGGAGISGNVNVGSNGLFNSSQSATGYFLAQGKTDTSLLYAKADSTYDQVVIGGSGFLGSFAAGAKLVVNSTDSILIPVGTTGNRPSNSGRTDVTGMVRFNTTVGDLEYYNGAAWVSPHVSFTVVSSEQFSLYSGNPNGNVDGINAVFTLTYAGTTNGTIVTINGVVQLPTSAYSIGGVGYTLTFTEPPAIGDVIDVRVLTTTSQVASLSDATGHYTINTSASNVYITTGATTANVISSWITNGAQVNSTPNVTIATSGVATTVDSFSATVYSSAEYTATATIAGTNIREICKILIVSNGTNVITNQFANTSTAANSLVAYSAQITSGTAYLQGAATNNNTIVRLHKNYQAI